MKSVLKLFLLFILWTWKHCNRLHVFSVTAGCLTLTINQIPNCQDSVNWKPNVNKTFYRLLVRIYKTYLTLIKMTRSWTGIYMVDIKQANFFGMKRMIFMKFYIPVQWLITHTICIFVPTGDPKYFCSEQNRARFSTVSGTVQHIHNRHFESTRHLPPSYVCRGHRNAYR